MFRLGSTVTRQAWDVAVNPGKCLFFLWPVLLGALLWVHAVGLFNTLGFVL